MSNESTYGKSATVDLERDYISLNAMLNLYDENGNIQFDKDKEAARQYFLNHVNSNTVFFHDLKEKLDYLVDEGYYDPRVLEKYNFSFVKSLFKRAYDYKMRFETFIGALKFYTQYALQSNSEEPRYLERYEDRVCVVALDLADGDEKLAVDIMDEIVTGRFQPATPTFLNAGMKNRGELVSCFPAGTKVSVKGGAKNIEDITVDDLVLSNDGDYHVVTDVMERESQDDGIVIKTANGAIEATEEHPLLVWTERSVPRTEKLRNTLDAVGKEYMEPALVGDGDDPRYGVHWLAAVDIREGDFLLLPSDHAGEFSDFEVKGRGYVATRVDGCAPGSLRGHKVYNLEVEGTHNYVVDGVSIVHNCFLLNTQDNMESIGSTIKAALQLSKRGGGVGINLTDTREYGAPIKGKPGQASGVVPIMKLLEDAFSYANQLGQRQGAGAVYLHACHPDLMRALDTKRENADEKIRIKSLSFGIIIPDVIFEVAKRDDDLYQFSPCDVERVYGKPMSQISISEVYDDMVEDPRIRKTKVNARALFQTIAELQFESGYPYLMFEDTVNRWNWIDGRVSQSNLCVAPETPVLTRDGYRSVDSLAGTDVEVWNGKKWSVARAEKTGVDQPLIRVNFSDGSHLNVTYYHKFYVDRGGAGVVETRAGELLPGDRLDQFDLPIVENPDSDSLPDAYEAGFSAFDSVSGESSNDSGSFLVPHDFDLKSRLEWLAGFIDSTGEGDSVSGIKVPFPDQGFLLDTRLMLTTLGVHSRVFNSTLFISGSEAQKLVSLGIDTRRVELSEYLSQNHEGHSVTVIGITDEGRVDDTYCLNEPGRHRLIFNGIETGNCSEILQVQTPQKYSTKDDSIIEEGRDVSCNLASLNIAKVMKSGDISKTVSVAVRGLTHVSDATSIGVVPSVRNGNEKSHSIGIGQMNLHGFLGEERIFYGSDEALDFVNVYFAAVKYAALKESMEIAKERGETFYDFEKSDYKWKPGENHSEALKNYTSGIWETHPHTERIRRMFEDYGQDFPTRADWQRLDREINEHGLYNAYLLAVAPTGSISYVNHSTPSIHPVAAKIEVRKEAKIGRIYSPAPGLNNENGEYYEDAYSLGYKPLIDTYAVATKHVDQGLSLTLFLQADNATTRDLNKAYIYAKSRETLVNEFGEVALYDPRTSWKSGYIKTIYYIRVRKNVLAGTEVEGCASCQV